MEAINITTADNAYPVFEPTVPAVLHGVGFYVSYSNCDPTRFGNDTTALVRGQLGNMERCYMLNGDHRKMYAPLIGIGFDACLDYFATKQQ